MLDLQQHLRQSRYPRCRFAMPNIGFHRPDPTKARLLGMLLESFAQRRYLDRITQLGAGAVRFYVADMPRVDMGFCQRPADSTALTLRAGHRVAIGLPPVIDGAASDDPVNVVAVSFCLRQPLQYDYTYSFSGYISISPLAKALSVAVTGEELPGAEHQVFIGMDTDVHPSGNGHADSPLF